MRAAAIIGRVSGRFSARIGRVSQRAAFHELAWKSHAMTGGAGHRASNQ
jgi:hypothetical protein